MKDLLAFLFQVKREAVDGESSSQDTVGRLLPLLREVATTKSTTMNSVIAFALCDYLLKNKEDIGANAMDKVIVRKHTSAKMKSGNLDKVNDDCLRLALSYLNFKDRCNSVELLSHRLFQLSRTVPIHCRDFSKVWNEDMDTLKVARRFKPEIFRFSNSSYGSRSMAVALAAIFRDCAKELQIWNTPNVDLSFNNLTTLLVFDASIDTLRRALLNNPEFVAANIYGEDAIAVLRCLSQAKSVCKLQLQQQSSELPPADFKCDLDFSHIKDLRLRRDTGHILPHFVHSKLQSLRLEMWNMSTANLSGPKPSALTFLKLDRVVVNGEDIAKKMQFFDECKFERVEIRERFSLLPQLCRHLATKHLLYEARGFDSDAHMTECLLLLTPILARLQSVALRFYYPKLYARIQSEQLRPFFVLLSQMLGVIGAVITVQIHKTLWVEITKEMAALSVDALMKRLRLEFMPEPIEYDKYDIGPLCDDLFIERML